LIAIQNAALRELAGCHYDKAIINAIVRNASPMLDEMIAREHCFVAECGGLLVGWGGWSARASAPGFVTLRFAAHAVGALCRSGRSGGFGGVY
jgi:hypothetical protein